MGVINIAKRAQTSIKKNITIDDARELEILNIEASLRVGI
jgi:hypothetical protein